MRHVAIILPVYCRLILSGEKTIECRLTKTRRVPFERVGHGDLIYIKERGGAIVGEANAGKVLSFDGLRPEDVDAIRREHNEGILGPVERWEAMRSSRYGTLIWLEDVRACDAPPDLSGVSIGARRSGWLTLD
ncbi:MAG: ASCH domain-containing protein [Planctomycetota bacterium]